MEDSLESAPELVFGLVAPIGVDLDLTTDLLTQSLREMGYVSHLLRLTELMKEIDVGVEISSAPFVKSYRDRIAYANAVRKKYGDNALAALAISGIRSFRREEWPRRKPDSQAAFLIDGRSQEEGLEKDPREIPLPKQAYIIRQLKRPDEIALLRSVYGKQFIQVSAFAPPAERIRRIEDGERKSRGGLASYTEVHSDAYALVMQDDNEATDEHGQNVRDAFPMGDVFIDVTSKPATERNLKRFIGLLFGDNEITPTHDEYGMYLAKSASLRSADLSRQVGAAIFRPSGEVISLGCNEVPKAGGGTYWCDDASDGRDFVQGFDPNDQKKLEVFVDLIERLCRQNLLSAKLKGIGEPGRITNELLKVAIFKESKLMDLLEFGRIIHAEMSAICDAARKGVDTQDATLFSTTFPCHLCAKHIVAAGIRRVVYLEPYPKSYATDLHRDSIDMEGDQKDRVRFEAFKGVSPFRYRDLFEKGRRKYSGGLAKRWSKGVKWPMIETYSPNYCELEVKVVVGLQDN